jgi:hypothetical protein
LILHIFDLKSGGRAFGQALDREMEPSAIVVFGMVSGNPDIELG